MASEITFPVAIIHRKIGPGAVLAEGLFYPEFARLGVNRGAAAEAERRNLAELIPRLAPAELIRKRRATTCREMTFTLLLEPPRRNEAWRDTLELTFHAVVWDHPRPLTEPGDPETRAQARSGTILARIIELGIEVIVDAGGDLTAALRREALSALRRLQLSIDLRRLAEVQTTQAFEVEWTELSVRVPSLKDRAIRAESEGEKKKSLLQEIATRIGGQSEPAYEVEQPVDEIEKALKANPPQSVLLIGPSGVGKTAAVRQLARRWAAAAHEPPLFQTSGARIVAGQSGFGMWEQRCQDLIKDCVKRRAVLHVGALVELLEVGKSEYNQSGIATFLRPAIGRGELLTIAEATPEQLPLIEKQDPQLLDAFRHITLEEPAERKGMAILQQFARDYPHRREAKLLALETTRRKKRRRKQRRADRAPEQPPAVAQVQDRELSPGALAAIDRLHRRYATYSAYPGRPLRFLENLLRDLPHVVDIANPRPPEPIQEDEVYRAFTLETGLPASIIDPAAALDLEKTHEWFSSRVVGQREAVNLVVDLLATVKAGLTRPNRPIASLLFIGPTGVGKTEMAKALAEFLFGSKERLTRFDMSEYADPVSVRRLVGGAFGSEGLLTARIREQPFSVLLLDEVEKAHGSFFDLLLQALGEARLTDAGGRLADFRNTVVILTSNLGAESYRQGMTGFSVGGGTPSKSHAIEHFARAVEQFLRPEMFNRLDRVVPFAPLEADTIRRIADREWHKVLHRDGVRFREMTISTSPVLLDHLARTGFDARYGARPLKRAMERELLAPLARQINRHTGDAPLAVAIGMGEHAPELEVRPVQGARGRSNREPGGPAGRFAATVQTLRRWHQLAAASSTVRELENEVYQLTLLEQNIYLKQQKKKKLRVNATDVLARLGRLREVSEEVARQRLEAFDLEDAALIRFHDGNEPGEGLERRLAEATRNWDRLLLLLYGLNAPVDEVTLALFSEHRAHLAELAAAYRNLAESHGLAVQMMRYDLPGDDNTPIPAMPASPPPQTHPNDTPTVETQLPTTAWLADRLYTTNPVKRLMIRKRLEPGRTEEYQTEQTIGIAMTFSGQGAHVRFWYESGIHSIESNQNRDGVNPDVMAFVAKEKLTEYRPPEVVIRKGFMKNYGLRREYQIEKGTMWDHALERAWSGLYGHLTNWLEPAVVASMRSRLLRLIVE